MGQKVVGFVPLALRDKRVDLMGQRGAVGDASDPFTYVSADGILFQADLDSPVRQRPQCQVPFWVPLDAYGAGR